VTRNKEALVLFLVTLFCALIFFAGYKIGWRDGWAEPYRVDGKEIEVLNDGTWKHR